MLLSNEDVEWNNWKKCPEQSVQNFQQTLAADVSGTDDLEGLPANLIEGYHLPLEISTVVKKWLLLSSCLAY